LHSARACKLRFRVLYRHGAGALAERSLQPGTGTTQVTLSTHYRQALPVYNSSWHAQGGTVLPVNYASGFKPGNQFERTVLTRARHLSASFAA
jgi:hypothetical protein